MRLISSSWELGDQGVEVSAVLTECLILSFNCPPVVLLVPNHPHGDESREPGDGGEDVTNNLHDWFSFGVEEAAEQCSVEILLMCWYQLVQTRDLVEKIVLELSPWYLQHLRHNIVSFVSTNQRPIIRLCYQSDFSISISFYLPIKNKYLVQLTNQKKVFTCEAT